MRVVLISDTHNMGPLPEIPDGDVLIHAGDLTMGGLVPEVSAALKWLSSLPHKHRVFIAGNHDFLFQEQEYTARRMAEDAGLTYLQDTSTTIDGLKIYGSPWQPWFHDWAFNLQRGPDIKAKWDLIPEDLDILVTHGPPAGMLDQIDKTKPEKVGSLDGLGAHLGCEDLARAVIQKSLQVHVFGHIHGGYGHVRQGGRNYVNASTCNEAYEPVNPPIVLEVLPNSTSGEPY